MILIKENIYRDYASLSLKHTNKGVK